MHTREWKMIISENIQFKLLHFVHVLKFNGNLNYRKKIMQKKMKKKKNLFDILDIQQQFIMMFHTCVNLSSTCLSRRKKWS